MWEKGTSQQPPRAGQRQAVRGVWGVQVVASWWRVELALGSSRAEEVSEGQAVRRGWAVAKAGPGPKHGHLFAAVYLSRCKGEQASVHWA
jgi:hypothetical protein